MIPQSWAQAGYQTIQTEDHSPSLRSLASPDSEAMHHRGGAWSETELIYGRVIEPVLKEVRPRIFSLGLGLGYNEVLTAARALQAGRADWSLVSYEADPWLRQAFVSFVRGEPLPPDVSETFAAIFARTGSADEVRSALNAALREGRWIVEAALEPETVVPFRVQGFLWDAFSQKTSPALWDEDFLKSFLSRSADDRAWLSTYACVGKMKRALKECGFTVEVRPGFLNKRSSTWAFRL